MLLLNSLNKGTIKNTIKIKKNIDSNKLQYVDECYSQH
jgi:cystathionine beta-lyase family protein involved in aluminum resistance